PAPVPAQVPTDVQPQPGLNPATEPATPPPPVEPPPAEPAPSAPTAGAHGTEVQLAEPALRPVPPEQVEGEEDWSDRFDFRLFVDGYFSVNYNFPKPQFNGNNYRAYDNSNGFSLAWAGGDVSYPAEPVGGMISLRFGPAAERLGAGCLSSTSPCDSAVGLSPVKQAFGSWRPGGADSAVQLDFGKFDTFYGAEVADSQDNLNYTRGFLYWLAQPAYHTGLRMGANFGEAFTLKAMLVNGINNTIDNNLGKTLGLQGVLNLTRSDDSALGNVALGYMIGPERDDTTVIECGPGEVFSPSNSSGCVAGTAGPTSGVVDRPTTNTKGLRHLIDLVATFTPVEGLTLVLNGDYGLESLRRATVGSEFDNVDWFGVMAAARYAFSDMFAIAGRGEYLGDPHGHVSGVGQDVNLVSGTLTLDLRPADFLIVRLDNRLDWASKEIFKNGVRDPGTPVIENGELALEPGAGTMVTTTLGVVVTTN
ncbi:MAG TPA: porin, partial [Polyangiaceae bacterium]|nr:porin [Polyangiaceae bacterium]